MYQSITTNGLLIGDPYSDLVAGRLALQNAGMSRQQQRNATHEQHHKPHNSN